MRYVFSASKVSCEIVVDGRPRTIFQNISFDIAPGEIVDLVGPSGAGKSSLLTAFARLNPRARGDFTLLGRAASTFTAQQWRALVAYLPQKPILPGDCVADAIRLPYTLAIRQSAVKNTGRKPKPAELLPDAKIRETLDAMGCVDIDLGRAPHDLSGGQAARVSLARTLLTNPKVLLADEVDAGLDDESADKVALILQRAAESGMAVIRIRHRPPDGRASRVMRLSDNRLVQVREGANA
jgi:putative ABC transport system ATP-binding protein